MVDNQFFAQSAPRQFAQPTGVHVSLGAPLRTILFVILTGIVALILFRTYGSGSTAIGGSVLAAILIGIIIGGVRVAAQWERGVLLRLGKFKAVRGPGILYVIPFVDYIRFVDTRTLVLNIPRQKVITKDNVPAQIDGAVFFLITDPERAITRVQDYQFAIAQYAQAALRDVVGRLSLDELLTEREQIQENIKESIEVHVQEWGLRIDSIRLLDIELPEDLKRMMSRQASAEREKRATITKAEGDKLAAVNLADAAAIMQTNAGAMQLRSLQTIDGLGASPSNTVVLFPIEWIELARAIVQSSNTHRPRPDTPGNEPRSGAHHNPEVR